MARIESNWELNISKYVGLDWADKPRYVGYCRIELGSGMPDDIKERAKEIAARFPAPEFQCELAYWECTGKLGIKY